MCVLPVSSQTVVSYLGYHLEAGTISAKSLQTCLSVINTVHNDFQYPPPACGHLVNLARKGFVNYNTPSCFNHSRSRRFLQSTCLLLCSSDFAPTPPITTSVSVCVCLLNSTSSATLIQGSFCQLSTFKRPLLRSPSINPPRMSREIKQHPPPEYRQLKTILTTDSTSSSQLFWKILRAHHDTKFYWSLEDDPESRFESSGIITE